MNKEIINKFKEEFDAWLAGKSVLIYDNGRWVSIGQDSDIWSKVHNKAKFILNDEHVALRQAEAEGKVIQYRLHMNESWRNCTTNSQVFRQQSAKEYRVRPPEPKFKVGDWVRLKIFDKTVHQILALSYCEREKCTHPRLSNFKGNIDCVEALEPWIPTKGEWCIFSNGKKDQIAIISKFDKLDKHVRPYITKKVGRFEHCEPFIGQLPQTLKDK